MPTLLHYRLFYKLPKTYKSLKLGRKAAKGKFEGLLLEALSEAFEKLFKKFLKLFAKTPIETPWLQISCTNPAIFLRRLLPTMISPDHRTQITQRKSFARLTMKLWVLWQIRTRETKWEKTIKLELADSKLISQWPFKGPSISHIESSQTWPVSKKRRIYHLWWKEAWNKPFMNFLILTCFACLHSIFFVFSITEILLLQDKQLPGRATRRWTLVARISANFHVAHKLFKKIFVNR